MPNNPPPPMPEWAIDALRELIDIAGLLNDEMFLSLGPPESGSIDPRQTICDRLRSLTETLTLTAGEPLVLPDPADYFGDEYLPTPDEFRKPA